MASVPSAGDKLIAKVRLFFYRDPECKIPMPPGNAGKGDLAYPERLAGDEVGTFTGVTGKSSDGQITYEVDWVFQFRVRPPWPNKAFDSINKLKSFVKGNEVTGFWDKGVDAPAPPKNDIIDLPPDNTNLYLGLALAGTAFVKFILPKIQNK